jgi:hypothetical protein
LVQERKLPATLLKPLVQTGALYADARANAVFLLLDTATLPVGAELRGTTVSAWRGMAPGSRKDRGFFGIPATTGDRRPQLPRPSFALPLSFHLRRQARPGLASIADRPRLTYLLRL